MMDLDESMERASESCRATPELEAGVRGGPSSFLTWMMTK